VDEEDWDLAILLTHQDAPKKNLALYYAVS